MIKCVFCEKVKKKEGFIFENDYFYSIFDKNPVSPGHALVIPKKHIVSLLDLPDKEWIHLKSAIQKTIEAIEHTDLKQLYQKLVQKKETQNSLQFGHKMLDHPSLNKRPDGYNIGVNDGKAAGRTIDHLHIQIIPRYFNDVKDAVGGLRHILPGMGNYKKPMA